MLGFITRQMVTGLVTILPIALTLYLLYWFFRSTESMLGGLLRFILPDAIYWPGMGVIAGLGLVFVIGLMMRNYVFQKLFSKTEELLFNVPLIKSVYGMLRDFFHYFSTSKDRDFQQVVTVDINGIQLVGFLTQSDMHQLPEGMTEPGDDKLLVYLPMSYMIGGYALLVPRSSVTMLDMSMEEAMRFALTAGVATSQQSHD